MNKRKTVFAQIISLVKEYEFKKCVDRYKGDRNAIKFNCRDQFMVMSFALFSNRTGLRDIQTKLKLCEDLYRSSIKVMTRSSLADTYVISFFQRVIQQKLPFGVQFHPS